jgi:hypothetical protein
MEKEAPEHAVPEPFFVFDPKNRPENTPLLIVIRFFVTETYLQTCKNAIVFSAHYLDFVLAVSLSEEPERTNQPVCGGRTHSGPVIWGPEIQPLHKKSE